MEVIQIFACVDKIERSEFSPDSDYILFGMLDRAAVQVFCIADPEWKCRINEGIAGMINCRWCPDSRHILIESDYGIQLAVWSLIDGTSAIISYPKPNNIISFSDDGCYCAIGLRIDLQDYIGFYSIDGESQKIVPNDTIKSMKNTSSVNTTTRKQTNTNTSSTSMNSNTNKKAGLNATATAKSNSIGSRLRNWEEICKFKCKSNDLSAIHFISNSHMIVAIDAAVHYRAIVYMPTGEVVMNYEAYSQALGIRTINMYKPPAHLNVTQSQSAQSQSNEVSEPTELSNPPRYSSNSTELLNIENNHGSLLAIGSYDSSVRLVSMRSWEMVQVLPSNHPRELGFAVDSGDSGSSGAGSGSGGNTNTNTNTNNGDVKGELADNYFVSMTVEMIGTSTGNGSNGTDTGADDFASDFESVSISNSSNMSTIDGGGSGGTGSGGPMSSSVFMNTINK